MTAAERTIPTVTSPPSPHPYSALTPDVVLDALDGAGHRGDGRLLSLGSYENRVYQVYRDDAPPLVAKFYRPGRWTDEQILEEHAFVAELAASEIPVVAPLATDGTTLHAFAGFRFAVVSEVRRPRARARGSRDARMARSLPRPHPRDRAAASFRVTAPRIDLESFGHASRDWLLDHDFIPADLLPAWRSIASQALDGVRHAYDRAGTVGTLRLHGDCHAGNVLWDSGPHFVDFDDARNGPAIQDLWMLLSGDRAAMSIQLRSGARRLRGLRGIRSARASSRRSAAHAPPAFTIRRGSQRAGTIRRFPAAFPWFNTQRYWQDRILELREQVALMDEPPLAV